MPSAAFEAQDIPDHTRWTPAQSDLPLLSPTVDRANMQANGRYFQHQYEPSSPRHESYDGSDYGSPVLDRTVSDEWTGATGTNGAHYEEHDYSQRLDERASPNISLNTRLAANPNTDEVGQHLLYETALLDSRTFDMLQISEVDSLKKEQARLKSRLEAANRKLALESKVKDAAQNLQRLYSINSKNRPDTPQSPGSPRRSGSSLLGDGVRESRGSVRVHGQTLHQADNELATSVKKVDELNEIIKGLQERQQMVEGKLLKHTAAVLAEQTARPTKISGSALSQRRPTEEENDGSSSYDPDEFDGIRDILQSAPGAKRQRSGNAQKLKEEHEQQLANVQDRLEQLNSQLRHVITEASRTRGISPEPDLEIIDQHDDANARLDKRFTRLEYNLRALEHEHDEQLETLNQELQAARETSGGASHAIENAQAAAASHAQKSSEYETTLSGLWEILQSDMAAWRSNGDHARDADGAERGSAATALKEDFSLQAFSSRVQHLFNRAQSANEQQEILRRQVQQQRELNGKSDAEKDRQLAELQSSHDQWSQAHAEVQEKLTVMVAQHAQAESEASESRSELMNVMNEFDGLKRTVDARQQERDELSRQLQAHQGNAHDLQDLESEVVRLTTELTMAKADLDGAYGSRAERAKEAQAAEVNGLNEQLQTLQSQHETALAQIENLKTGSSRTDHTRALERELQDMTTEFQELTRESVELEKEREQLDSLIDDLRDRCETLETQLTDEKVRWMGTKAPNGTQDAPPNGREMTSTMVLRQEFKKMMRETRAEGLKLLRAEQEERRKLEAELRRLRQANGPLATRANGLGATANPVPPST